MQKKNGSEEFCSCVLHQLRCIISFYRYIFHIYPRFNVIYWFLTWMVLPEGIWLSQKVPQKKIINVTLPIKFDRSIYINNLFVCYYITQNDPYALYPNMLTLVRYSILYHYFSCILIGWCQCIVRQFNVFTVSQSMIIIDCKVEITSNTS